jgi:hypothetical protein
VVALVLLLVVLLPLLLVLHLLQDKLRLQLVVPLQHQDKCLLLVQPQPQEWLPPLLVVPHLPLVLLLPLLLVLLLLLVLVLKCFNIDY